MSKKIGPLWRNLAACKSLRKIFTQIFPNYKMFYFKYNLKLTQKYFCIVGDICKKFRPVRNNYWAIMSRNVSAILKNFL